MDMVILLVGVGRWGKNHLKVLTQLVKEIYVVDLDPHQLEIYKDFSIPPDHLSTNYLDFIDLVDGVDVVTPADSHLTICRECLNKGKDVFVEKPIPLTSKKTKEIKKRVLMVIDYGQYILGNQCRKFEKGFAKFIRVTHIVLTSSGTSAIFIFLKALRVDQGMGFWFSLSLLFQRWNPVICRSNDYFY